MIKVEDFEPGVEITTFSMVLIRADTSNNMGIVNSSVLDSVFLLLCQPLKNKSYVQISI